MILSKFSFCVPWEEGETPHGLFDEIFIFRLTSLNGFVLLSIFCSYRNMLLIKLKLMEVMSQK